MHTLLTRTNTHALARTPTHPHKHAIRHQSMLQANTTFIISSIHTHLAGVRGQTIVLALSREYKWGFSFHVSGSHTVRRDSSVMWEFLGALS